MFTMDDLEIKVTFSHDRDTKIFNGTTECRVWATTGEPLFIGLSLCSIHDNFCYETGRKQALARALVDFDRETRKRIWFKYFETRGKVPKSLQ